MKCKKLKAIRLLIPILFLILTIAGVNSTYSNDLSNILNQFKIHNNSIKKPVADNNIKFVQLTDTHLDSRAKVNVTARMYADSRGLLQEAVRQVNGLSDIDFVLFSGDMINRPNSNDLNEFLKVAGELKAPWYIALGNHDIGVKSYFNKPNYIKTVAQSNKNFNTEKPYYSFSPEKGYLVIAMDGVIDNSVTSNGYFEKKQLAWLDKELEKNKNSKVVIFQHFPVVEPFKSHTHRVKNADEYLKIINKHNNVVAVLSGHYHAAKIQKVNNVYHISTPGLIEYPNAFRVITIEDKKDKLILKTEIQETNLKELQQKSKDKSGSWQLHYGSEADRNNTFIIPKVKAQAVQSH